MERFIHDMGFWYEGDTLAYPLIFSDCTIEYFIMEIERALEYYDEDSWWRKYDLAMSQLEENMQA